MDWPPTVADLKVDARIEDADTRDDDALSLVLDAAVAFVERVRPVFNFTGLVNVNTAEVVSLQTLPGVDATLAQAIVDGRPYADLPGLQAVVGDDVFVGLAPLVTVYGDPTEDLFLGTIRLAHRWHVRRRSPDGLVNMSDLGTARVPSFDPDIERLLGIGRYSGPVFA